MVGEYPKPPSVAQSIPSSVAKEISRDEVMTRPSDLSAASFAKVYPLRLMLAEDNLLNQQLMTYPRQIRLRWFVRCWQWKTSIWSIPSIGSAASTRKAIEAIFMDMQMPEVEGPEATHLIRTFCRQTGCPQPHIMALTAKAFFRGQAECMRAGM